jgi:glycosyltransferase involved in cell wall biosynthesis
MDNTPKISVIMPVYNGRKFLKEAIFSVLNQTEKDFELIIVDDGSTDSSANIAKSFADDRIKFFEKEHSGLIDTLNFGIKKARGEFIARMDADDISEPNRFAEELKFFKEHPNYALVGSFATAINESGEATREMDYPPADWNAVKKYSLLHNPFIHPSVMVKKSILDKAGAYRKPFRNIEDYELWTRIMYRYPSGNIPKPLLRYRMHEGQVTKRANIQMRMRGILVRLLALLRFLLAIVFSRKSS